VKADVWSRIRFGSAYFRPSTHQETASHSQTVSLERSLWDLLPRRNDPDNLPFRNDHVYGTVTDFGRDRRSVTAFTNTAKINIVSSDVG
jgi:hypothetical protein